MKFGGGEDPVLYLNNPDGMSAKLRRRTLDHIAELNRMNLDEVGDQLVQVTVETPTRLDNKQQELLREFAALENKSVSPKSASFFEKLKQHFG